MLLKELRQTLMCVGMTLSVLCEPCIGDPAIDVKPGLFQAERKSLLARIYKAANAGVGIKPYLDAFSNIEATVAAGSVDEVAVQARLASLSMSLDAQLHGRKQTSQKTSSDEPVLVGPDIGILGFKFKLAFGRDPEIATVFPDTPAEKEQLQAGDVILSVDGVSTKGLDKEAIYQKLVGKPNTKVGLTVRRGDRSFEKTLIRMHSKDFAKVHPDIWRMYVSSM